MKVLWVIGALALLAAGCGDDGGNGEAAAAYCDAYSAAYRYLDEDDVDPVQAQTLFDAAATAGPEGAADAMRTVVAKYGEYFGDPDAGEEAIFQALGDAELLDATETTDRVLLDDCDYGSLDLVGKNYAYEDAPTKLDAGTYVLDLNNKGTELHEAVVMRINDDVDLSVDELLVLPEEEGQSKVTFAGATFALPGTDGLSALIDLSEPGRYVIACFIPVGSIPEALAGGQEPNGAPHFTQGMKQELLVS